MRALVALDAVDDLDHRDVQNTFLRDVDRITVPAERSRLVISSQLLELAQIVDTSMGLKLASCADPAPAQAEGGQLTLAFNHMLDEIQDRDSALHASEEKYRLLFDANPNPMWVYDPDTLAFLAVNQAAVRQYGYSPDEFLAMTIKQIPLREDDPVRLDQPQGLPADLGRWDGLGRHRRKDGSTLSAGRRSSSPTCST
jgi:PAS domain S-box-containing protein